MVSEARMAVFTTRKRYHIATLISTLSVSVWGCHWDACEDFVRDRETLIDASIAGDSGPDPLPDIRDHPCHYAIDL
ncbi:unnamed protein product, partial [Allacma fusca]